MKYLDNIGISVIDRPCNKIRLTEYISDDLWYLLRNGFRGEYNGSWVENRLNNKGHEIIKNYIEGELMEDI